MSTHSNKYPRCSDPRTNPCVKEGALSRKCLEDNHYVKEKCTDFFDNYRSCTKFWLDIQKERRRKGIKPIMPDEKERELIMEERKKGCFAGVPQSKPN